MKHKDNKNFYSAKNISIRPNNFYKCQTPGYLLVTITFSQAEPDEFCVAFPGISLFDCFILPDQGIFKVFFEQRLIGHGQCHLYDIIRNILYSQHSGDLYRSPAA